MKGEVIDSYWRLAQEIPKAQSTRIWERVLGVELCIPVWHFSLGGGEETGQQAVWPFGVARERYSHITAALRLVSWPTCRRSSLPAVGEERIPSHGCGHPCSVLHIQPLLQPAELLLVAVPHAEELLRSFLTGDSKIDTPPTSPDKMARIYNFLLL